MYEDAINLIKKHEGLRLKPYRCAQGKLTIAYGFNLDTGITHEIAQYLLMVKFNENVSLLDAQLPWWNDQPMIVKNVFLNMTYQLGFAGFKKFKKFLSFIQCKDYQNASKEMLNSLWAKQTPLRANELSNMIKSVK